MARGDLRCARADDGRPDPRQEGRDFAVEPGHEQWKGEAGAPQGVRVLAARRNLADHEQTGQGVQAGQTVATIEAMKMEAAITTPIAGVVRRLAIGAVQQLEGGDLVLVIE